MCHTDRHWTEALPLVLLGIRSSFKADLHTSSAELVYGDIENPRRVPDTDNTSCRTSAHHSIAPTHGSTPSCSSYTPRPSRNLRPQRPPYLYTLLSPFWTLTAWPWNLLIVAPTGSYPVERRHSACSSEGTLSVSTDRVKPAYILNEADSTPSDSNPAATPPPIALPATPPTTSPPYPLPRTTRCDRHVHFPARFNR
jgi:hypothetical protein